MPRTATILFPTDFSSFSNQAYLHAVSLAEANHASLTVAYVTPAGTAAEREYWTGQLTQIRPANPAISVHHVLLEGDPAQEIVRHAREGAFDLIVMGTHGRTGIERQLMGSVAESVLREAHCSVLVVKLPRSVPRNPDSDAALLIKG